MGTKVPSLYKKQETSDLNPSIEQKGPRVFNVIIGQLVFCPGKQELPIQAGRIFRESKGGANAINAGMADAFYGKVD